MGPRTAFGFVTPLTLATVVVLCGLTLSLGLTGCGQSTGIRAGVATEDITPSELPIWLSGYAARKSPAKEVRQRIFTKALAFEDAQGNRSVVVGIDIIGIPRVLRDQIAEAVRSEHGLAPEALLLNSSHTHSGPAVRDNLEMLFSFEEAEKERTQRYREFLKQQIVSAVGKALGSMEPATLRLGEGTASFAINRRAQRFLAADPEAKPISPIDHSVPVLRVERADGSVLALLFGYSCHNTTLTAEFNAIAGDYAGFAQEALEATYPGTTALFLALCGGDQNPEPRSRADLAEQHGNALAASVKAVADDREAMDPISGSLRHALRFQPLALQSRSREDIEAERNHTDTYRQRRAAWVLQRIERGEDPSVIDYPVQVLRLGERFGIVGLGGEVVVDYGLNIKSAYPGLRLIVAGYSNDVMGYIPTRRILGEGGYEADDSMIYYGQQAPFTDDVEDKVMEAVHAAMADAGFTR
jgi:neutral ceramidase